MSDYRYLKSQYSMVYNEVREFIYLSKLGVLGILYP